MNVGGSCPANFIIKKSLFLLGVDHYITLCIGLKPKRKISIDFKYMLIIHYIHLFPS